MKTFARILIGICSFIACLHWLNHAFTANNSFQSEISMILAVIFGFVFWATIRWECYK